MMEHQILGTVDENAFIEEFEAASKDAFELSYAELLDLIKEIESKVWQH